MALVDRGANGIVCGDDMRVLEGSKRFVDVSGLGGHCENQLRIVTAQALIETHKGNVIAVFHQIALLGKGKSILSCLQMEHYGAEINEKSLLLPGGQQHIVMDGCQIPLTFRNGHAYLKCCPPTDDEVDYLPHVIMTADVDWDPTPYDNVISDHQKFYDPDIEEVNPGHFNDQGNYLHCTVPTHLVQPESEFFDVHEYLAYDDLIDDIVDALNPTVVQDIYQVNNLDIRAPSKDYNVLRPFFAWVPADTIKKTVEVTTQYAWALFVNNGNLIFLHATFAVPMKLLLVLIQSSVTPQRLTVV
jgi:hypothetical protein